MLAELGLDVVDLRPDTLTLEHPGADLDRVADRLLARLAGLDALAHELGGALVIDLEALDHEAVVEGPHGRALGVDMRVFEASMRTHEGSRVLGRESDCGGFAAWPASAGANTAPADKL